MRRAEEQVPERGRVHMLVFDEAETTLGAVRRLREEGFEVADVYSPFPLHGADEALGLRPTRIALATLVGGLVGGVGKLGFEAWVHVVDWPMNIGGKSDTALPALVPVTFEITVLLAAFATLGALFLRRRLFPRLVPAPAPRQPHPRSHRRRRLRSTRLRSRTPRRSTRLHRYHRSQKSLRPKTSRQRHRWQLRHRRHSRRC